MALDQDLKNPIRRAFLIYSIKEIKTKEDYLIEVIGSLKEHMIELTDILGVSIINSMPYRKRPIKNIIKRESNANIIVLPDGRQIEIMGYNE